jgi:hypothetical protein
MATMDFSAAQDGWRERLMRWLVKKLHGLYRFAQYRDTVAWGLTLYDLQQFPANSTGRALAEFLQQHGFELMPKFESHDLFHVWLGYGVTVVDEVRMQCCLAGSGRRTPPTLAVIAVGVVFYPEYSNDFWQHYQRGKSMVNFSDWDFQSVLLKPLTLPPVRHRSASAMP